MSLGRPLIFETDEQLKAAIQDYFDNHLTQKTIQITSKKSITVKCPTITGLCYHLGFESRQSFYDYEKREAFSYTVKRARLFIEKEYEEQLISGNTIGAIFALKNFGWSDRQEIKHEGIPDQKFTYIVEKPVDE